MTMKTKIRNVALVLTAIAGMATVPVQAHHSFAMYDTAKPVAVTGVLVRSNPDAFHYQMFIAQLDADRKAVVRDKDGKPVIWAVELEGAAQVASQGVTEKNFPAGTIVSIGFYPLRNGNPGGTRNEFGLFKCPEKTPPAANAYCDSVTGNETFGEGVIPAGIDEGKAVTAQ